MEWEVRRHRQWRLGGSNSRTGDGTAVAERICLGVYGYGPRGKRRGLRARSPREADRLQLSCRARNDRQGEGDNYPILRKAFTALLLYGVLAGWPARPQGSAVISNGL